MGGITRELEGTLKEGGQASRDERIPFSWGVFTQYPALGKGEGLDCQAGVLVVQVSNSGRQGHGDFVLSQGDFQLQRTQWCTYLKNEDILGHHTGSLISKKKTALTSVAQIACTNHFTCTILLTFFIEKPVCSVELSHFCQPQCTCMSFHEAD